MRLTFNALSLTLLVTACSSQPRQAAPVDVRPLADAAVSACERSGYVRGSAPWLECVNRIGHASIDRAYAPPPSDGTTRCERESGTSAVICRPQ